MPIDRQEKPVNSARYLILAGLATIIIWQIPYGHQILYPFTLLATYAHEMGHGLAAMLTGAEFEQLVLFPNGSGFARYRGHDIGRLSRAFIAAGGLVGPSIAGATLLALASRTGKYRFLLKVLAVLMLASGLIWARSLFSLVFAFGFAAAFWFGSRTKGSGPAFLVHLVAVQLCLSVFSDLDYMFSDGAVVDGKVSLSDVSQIEQALFLPYWIWGGLVAMVSFAVLGFGLWQSLKVQTR